VRSGDASAAANWRSPEEREEGGRVYEVAPVRNGRLQLRFANNAIDFGRVRIGDWVWRSHDPEGLLPKDAPGARVAVTEGKLLWVPDATIDPRFRDRPNVTKSDGLRFYAAAPIRLEDGSIPGVLAVAGNEVTPYDAQRAAHLQDLADFVADEWSRVRSREAQEAAHRESDLARRMVSTFIECAPIALVMTPTEG